MKLTKTHKEIKIEFEEDDSFELKQLMQLNIDSIWQLVKMLTIKK